MKPIILTCAVVGAGPTRKDNPAIPYTPAEIAASTVEAAKAGATIAHIHVRDPVTGVPSMELELYRETVKLIRASGVDIVLNLTTGAGSRLDFQPDDMLVPGPKTTLSTPKKRVEHVLELKPEICTLDLNTMFSRTSVVINHPQHVTEMAELVQAAGVRPEIECFNVGDIVLALELIRNGVLKGQQLFQMVLGVRYGVPAQTSMIQAMREMLPPDAEWACFGIGRMAYAMMAQSIILGGHARVGFEDNVYLERGVLAPGNGALVERAVRIIRDLGNAVATPDEARKMLGLR